jgi:hypothetical protein
MLNPLLLIPNSEFRPLLNTGLILGGTCVHMPTYPTDPSMPALSFQDSLPVIVVVGLVSGGDTPR